MHSADLATHLSLDCFSLCSTLLSLVLSGGENTLRTRTREEEQGSMRTLEMTINNSVYQLQRGAWSVSSGLPLPSHSGLQLPAWEQPACRTSSHDIHTSVIHLNPMINHMMQCTCHMTHIHQSHVTYKSHMTHTSVTLCTYLSHTRLNWGEPEQAPPSGVAERNVCLYRMSSHKSLVLLFCMFLRHVLIQK